MPGAGLDLLGLLLESHYSVTGHFTQFLISLSSELRRYAYTSPAFPTSLPPSPPSPPPSWVANQLGGTTEVPIPVIVVFPDSLSPLTLSVEHAASSVFYGYPAPVTGSPVSLSGRVLGAVYGTTPPPPAPPGPPPVYQRDATFPVGFTFPPDFLWPSDRPENQFSPWYFIMYYGTLLPILKDLPVAHKLS